MKIYSWNVNGIRAVMRKDAILPFMETENPDIVCIQETKAQPHESGLDLPGYQIYWNSAVKKGYSGTALISKTVPLRTINDLPENITFKYGITDDGYGDPNIEGRVLTAEYDQFYLVTVYTPNAKDDLTRLPLRHNHWDPAFLEYCQGLETGQFGGKPKPIVFCGDLNVAHTELDLANPKPNRGKKGFTDEERAGFQAFIDAGFVDTLRIFKQGNGFYTWWSHFAASRARNVGWRIDYFLVSASLRDRVSAADIYPAITGSDHCPISLTLDI